jgi:hypothetical protein
MPTDDRIELSNPKAYISGLIARVGGRDPLDVMAETPRVLVELARSAPPDVLRKRPFEGKWSPVEVLGHLVDTEFVFGHRIRAIFADESPTIIGMDQENWVRAQRYSDRDAADVAADFAAIRAVNLKLYRAIPKTAYDRVGMHNERGEERLGDMIPYCAGHDLSHIDQFQRYAAAAKAL